MFARLLALPIALFAAVAPAQIAVQDPVFTTGSTDQLDCRVLEVRPVDGVTQLLTVEVKNRGAAAAEPIEFRIELKERKVQPPRSELYRRVQLPLVQRFGRPAPAGGKQTYVLATNLPGKKAQYAVSVTTACWCDGGVVAQPDLHVSEPEQVQRTSLVGTFPVTRVELQNPFDREVDVRLLVTLAQPTDCVEVMGLRLPAGGRESWVISTRVGAQPFVESDIPPGGAVKATRFEVVDWSLVAPCAKDSGATLLRPAYEAWYRWPDAALEVSGRFRFHEHRLKLNSSTEYNDFEVTGRFTLPAHGAPVVQVESGSGANAGPAIAAAFANLRRPDFAALAASNALVLLATDRVEIRGRGWSGQDHSLSTTGGTRDRAGFAADAQVTGGRIVSTGLGDDERQTWRWQDLPGGCLVRERRTKSQWTSFTYAQQDGLWVPRGSNGTTQFGDSLFANEVLTLSDLSFGGKDRIAPPPPTGEGVAALRALWDAGYHLPTQPLVLTATFDVTVPGTDLVWMRQQRVHGRLQMTGIGRSMRSLHCEFAGDLSPELQHGLANAFHDRLLMWYGRDFNDRDPFDQFLAGAMVHAPDASGRFAVEHGVVAAVLTQGGLVRGFEYSDGSKSQFGYDKLDGRMVVTRYEGELRGVDTRGKGRWTEVVSMRYGKVGEWLLPEQLRFERIFGRDWGPEVIVLKDLRVK